MQTAQIPETRDIKKAFGANVERFRELAHLSRFQLAADAEMDPKILSSIERGTHNPTLCTIGKIADSIGVPPARLLSEDPPPATFQLADLQPQFDALSSAQQAQLLSIIQAYFRVSP